MPHITLPDGSKRSFNQPVSVAEVASNIGAGLAKAALAGRVDGKLVDTIFFKRQCVGKCGSFGKRNIFILLIDIQLLCTLPIHRY